MKSLALREAFELPFPKYRDAYFKKGISDRPGDTSLDLAGKGCFYFATTGQAVWSEGKQLKNVLKCKNPRCITTTEQELPHIFKLADEEQRVYRCLYCESRAK